MVRKLIQLLPAVAIALFVNQANAQWTVTGAVVHPATLTNNVSIGTTVNGANLYVERSAAVTMGIKSVTAGATMFMDKGLLTANAAFAYKLLGTTLWNSGMLGGKNFSIRDVTANTFPLTILQISGNVGVGISAPTEKLHVQGNVLVTNTISALGGNSTDWNTAYTWGNHATAGYIISETDPKVSITSLDYVPKWNGTALVASNMIIDNLGNAGIGTSAPLVTLHTQGTGLLVNGSVASGPTINIQNSGAIMLFYSKKAAFRAGRLLDDAVQPGDETLCWVSDSIGLYSTAAGLNVRATGAQSTSFGNYCVATGPNSFAAGRLCKASGNAAVSLGFESSASGPYSMAINSNTIAKGNASFAACNNTIATGDNAAGFGSDNFVEGDQSFASGYFNLARGENATVFGSNNIASGMNSLVIGVYNDTSFNNPDLITEASELFQVGIGNTHTSRKNAFAVRKSGTVLIGDKGFKPEGQFSVLCNSDLVSWSDAAFYLGDADNRWGAVYSVNGTINTSDAREKQNIHSLTYGTNELMKLNPVSFTWKNNPEQGVKLGLIAQDIQKVLPEVVVDKTWDIQGADGKRMSRPADKLGVYYSDIIPVLIKGFQEQQLAIEKTQTENSELKSMLLQLTTKLTILENDINSCCDTHTKRETNATDLSIKDVPYLLQNAPNPTNSETDINYYIPVSINNATLIIANENGMIVKSISNLSNGKGTLRINADELSAGKYTYSLVMDGITLSRIMIISK